MKIAVLGTGMVGKTLAAALVKAGHTVAIGTRSPDATLAKDVPMEAEPIRYEDWLAARDGIAMHTFADAAVDADMVISSLSGKHAVPTLSQLAESLSGKVVVDTTNPLDFPDGPAPLLTVMNDDSLSEQIQRALPDARIVKALNTVGFSVMTRPAEIAGGNHILPICGNNSEAKTTVRSVLAELGWTESQMIDLGDLSNARGMEAYMLYWFRLMHALGTADFNIAIQR